ncbi:Hypothetical protein PBC10988_33770 [Planctomycetales bacterium 10988]|nr:Hypothetical protein PBC10988_33770 [Planctomycetales bacterium 10988]
MANLQELLKHVPSSYQERFLEIRTLLADFCKKHLNDEYFQACERMAVEVCQEGTPVLRGKAASWASGVMYAIARVNFLTDPNQTPHMKAEEIAEGLGVSTATMYAKKRVIEDGLELIPFDPDFTIESRADSNPLNWLFELDGFIFDIRSAPVEIQMAAVESGLIPYIPEESLAEDEPDVLPFPTIQPQAPEESPQPRKQSRASKKKKKASKKSKKAGIIPSPSQPDLEGFRPLDAIPIRKRLYQLMIFLLGSDPPIWRRIQVKNCSLDKLHEHIQYAMGWTDSHMYQFITEDKRYGDPFLFEDDFDSQIHGDAPKVKFRDLIPESGESFRFVYEYDFGDGWEHGIEFEGCLEVKKGVRYPLCLEGENACPPEDIGGIWGYYDFLKALANPKHEGHEDAAEWVDGKFDPSAFSAKEATKMMQEGF